MDHLSRLLLPSPLSGFTLSSSEFTRRQSSPCWLYTVSNVHKKHYGYLIIGTVSLAMEAIGDITASAEVSRVEVEGEEFDSRIQGGVLGDGIGGLLSGLMT